MNLSQDIEFRYDAAEIVPGRWVARYWIPASGLIVTGLRLQALDEGDVRRQLVNHVRRQVNELAHPPKHKLN